MPSLDNHQNTQLVKGLIIGDPGAGKTGGLTSLVRAGYKLRIYDFDNLLGSLVQFVRKDCPGNLANVAYQTFTDKMKGNENPLQMVGGRMNVPAFNDGIPTAFVKCLKQLNHWKCEGEDLGKPGEWGADTVVVLDSLTTLSSAAYRYVQGMNPGAKEPQAQFFAAQQLIINLLTLLCSENFATNVLVLAHIHYQDNHLNIQKGFPRSVGSALNQQIGAYFNCVLMAESQGQKRQLRTNSNGIVDLKNPVSFKLPDTLPLETGLATFFETVLGK